MWAADGGGRAPREGWVRRYLALMRVGWLVDLQYRAAIVIWLVLGAAQPLVSLAIWWVVAGGGEVGGFGRADFARYFFALMLVDQLTLAWDVWYIDRWIREGEMNFRLARPLDPIHEAIADNLAYKAKSAALTAGVWAVTAVFWPAVRLPFEPAQWLLAGMAVVPAMAIRFLSTYVNGLLAFWTTRATAIAELQYGLSLFLSGRIAPLSLLPPVVTAAAGVLWFPYMLAFPVEVLTGQVTAGPEYLRGLGWQLLWVGIWLGLYRVVWVRGRRRYGAVGG